MKIEVGSRIYRPIKDIAPGTVFSFGGNLYIRIDLDDENLPSSISKYACHMAVNLSDGKIRFFPSQVSPLIPRERPEDEAEIFPDLVISIPN